jgi:1-deoxy-D-xylulose-5-phosphate synthase
MWRPTPWNVAAERRRHASSYAAVEQDLDQPSPTPLFDQVDNPVDLKKIPREQLPQLCAELRKVILDTVSITGGHLGSGMGVVELTVALHYLFDFRDDRLVWDVGHQCYPHKLLTERKARFHTLRQKGGLSGFSNKWESPYDAYLMGHAGTAASAALGIAMGDRMQGRSATRWPSSAMRRWAAASPSRRSTTAARSRRSGCW